VKQRVDDLWDELGIFNIGSSVDKH
jgi:hypothetical protein